MKRVELVGIQLDANSGISVLLLREHDEPHRVLPIMIGGLEATSIAVAATGQRASRPLTHDLMATLVERLDGHLDAVEVTDFLDGTFVAQLAVSGPAGTLQLDTRPSDAIALALRLHAPLFVSEHVLDEAGTVPAPDVDPETIDAEVADFRAFLDDIDPSEFLDGNDGGPNDDGSSDEPEFDGPVEES